MFNLYRARAGTPHWGLHNKGRIGAHQLAMAGIALAIARISVMQHPGQDAAVDDTVGKYSV